MPGDARPGRASWLAERRRSSVCGCTGHRRRLLANNVLLLACTWALASMPVPWPPAVPVRWPSPPVPLPLATQVLADLMQYSSIQPLAGGHAAAVVLLRAGRGGRRPDIRARDDGIASERNVLWLAKVKE
jgi:hypothetical protein